MLRIAECGGEMTDCSEKGLVIVGFRFCYLAQVNGYSLGAWGDWVMGWRSEVADGLG